jgi:hypothetical protein
MTLINNRVPLPVTMPALGRLFPPGRYSSNAGYHLQDSSRAVSRIKSLQRFICRPNADVVFSVLPVSRAGQTPPLPQVKGLFEAPVLGSRRPITVRRLRIDDRAGRRGISTSAKVKDLSLTITFNASRCRMNCRVTDPNAADFAPATAQKKAGSPI